MKDLQRITDNLERLMGETGLTSQLRLAKAAGISQTNLSNIMRHAVQPQLDTLSALAKALGVETWELLAPETAGQFIRQYQSASVENQQVILRIVRSLTDHRDETL